LGPRNVNKRLPTSMASTFAVIDSILSISSARAGLATLLAAIAAALITNIDMNFIATLLSLLKASSGD
jgi:hypothetical protein